MELRAPVEAAKVAEWPCTVISDYEGIIRTAQAGGAPETCRPLREELCAATAGKDVRLARRRDKSLGSRLAHQPDTSRQTRS